MWVLRSGVMDRQYRSRSMRRTCILGTIRVSGDRGIAERRESGDMLVAISV